ncbi:MAG: PKD domain-containing protein [Bacteroidia bacterium]
MKIRLFISKCISQFLPVTLFFVFTMAGNFLFAQQKLKFSGGLEYATLDEYYAARKKQVDTEHDLVNRISSPASLQEIFEKACRTAGVKAYDKAGFTDMISERFFYKDRYEISNKILKGEITDANIEQFKELKIKEFASYYGSMYLKGQYSFFPDIKKIKLADDDLNSGLKTGNNNGTFSVACNNEDFETGTTAGWSGRYGISSFFFPNCGATTPNPMGTVGFDLGANNSGTFQHTFMTGGNDPVGGAALPCMDPFAAGTRTFRLGDLNDGCEAAQITKTFMVTAANSNFTYDYGVVMYDGHLAADAPKFTISMTDQSGAAIGCAAYTVDATQAANPASGFLSSATFGLYYKPWSRVFVPLTGYVGQNVTITFSVSDCNGQAHRGYAYIDCYCQPFQLIQSSPTICGASSITISAPAGAATYSWATSGGGNIVSGGSTQTATIDAGGSYSVTMTAFGSGCSYTIDTVVPFSPGTPPVANFSSTVPCLGSPAVFTDLSTNSPTAWTWDFGDGSAASSTQSPSHSYAAAGTYTVTLTANNGCPNTFTTTVTVSAGTTSAFSTAAVCDGSPVTFTNTSTGVAGAAYTWDFGDTQTTSNAGGNVTHTYTGAATYNATLTITAPGGCNSTITHPVIVNANPVPSFTSVSVCQGVASSFTNTTPAAPAIGTWSWNFGDAATSGIQTPTHTYGTAGTFTTTLTATTTAVPGCVGTYTATVVVNPNPVASFTASTACEGTATVFNSSASSIAAPDNIAFYNWTFGDASSTSGPNPNHTYATCGTYTANLVVLSNNNCTNATNVTITVNCIPVANFTSTTVCQGLPTVLTDASTVANGTITGWCWDLDGNPGTCEITTAGPTGFVSPVSGTAPVSLTVSSNSGCTNSITLPVTVNPVPIGTFTPFSACSGAAINFNNTTAGGSQTSSWDFDGDGVQDAVGSPTIHTYAAPGVNNITLITTDPNGCKDTVTQALTVYPNPVAGFSAPSVCFGFSTPLSDGSTVAAAPGANSINAWSWDFDGNGTADNATQNPGNIFPSVGNTSVSLTVTTNNNCTNSITLPIHVDPLPVVSFTAANVCFGFPSVFNNTSSISAGTITGWSWDYTSNGSADNLTQSPSFMYPSSGTFNASLTASSDSGCVTTQSVAVTVYALPVASFTPINACSGVAINFTNTTPGGPQGSSWDFDNDGVQDAAISPVPHTYNTANTYSVTLITTDANGCKDTLGQNISVYANPVAGFTYSSVCYNSSTPLTDASTVAAVPGASNITGWSWDFDNNGTVDNTTQNPGFIFPNFGTTSVGLTVTTNNGCSDNVVLPIHVDPNPVVNFSAPGVCLNVPTVFSNTSTLALGSIAQWDWDFTNNGSIDNNSQLPSTTYTAPGTYTVQLTATSDSGCVTSKLVSIDVYPLPVASFSYSHTCQGSATVFSDLSAVGAPDAVQAWSWDFDNNGSTDNISQNPSTIIPSSGSQAVNLIVTTNHSCRDTINIPIYINPNPVPTIGVDKPAGCATWNVNLAGGVTAASVSHAGSIVKWDWDVDYSGNTDVSHNTVPGTDTDVLNQDYYNTDHVNIATYNVSLTATSDSGCVGTSFTASPLVTVYPIPLADFSWGPTEPAPDIDMPQVNFFNQAIGASSMSWDFGDIFATNPATNSSNLFNPEHYYENYDPYTYTVTQAVANTYGCVDTIKKPVEILPNWTFYIPNAYTPNNDGINDGFRGTGIGISNYNLWIYDRWGNMIFYSNELDAYWNGTVQGKGDGIVQEDVYVWKVKFKDLRGKKHDYEGTVTVVK